VRRSARSGGTVALAAALGIVTITTARPALTEATSQQKEVTSAQQSEAASARQGEATSANPASGDPAEIAQGHHLYVKWCQQCHGVKADGVSERWGKYAADLRVFWRGYYEFVRIVVEGRPDKQMPPWGGVLDGNDIAEIGAYLETQAIDGANWK
jgi:mono/diheme cytochrome c family protein